MQQTKAIKASASWSEKDIAKDFGSSITRISKEWMLITAGTKDDYNTMTASWGGMGYLWERPFAIAFVRPTRHTFEFTEREEFFTLSFFDKSIKSKVHRVCGNKSGANVDKAKEASITPIYFDDHIVSFEEASDIIVCKKIYTENFKPSQFLDKSVEEFYPLKDYHRIYFAQIEKYYKKA